MTINPLLKTCHHLVSQYLQPGDVAVDATAGNGHDTLFLARQISPGGRVWAFDIQQQALAKTRSLLSKHGLADRVTLVLDDHGAIADHVRPPVAVAMFNLGWLPGGDKSVVTRPETTLRAIKLCLELIRPGGAISIVTYSGHPGGQEEEEAVSTFCRDLDPAHFTVLTVAMANKPNRPPQLWLIDKAVQ